MLSGAANKNDEAFLYRQERIEKAKPWLARGRLGYGSRRKCTCFRFESALPIQKCLVVFGRVSAESLPNTTRHFLSAWACRNSQSAARYTPSAKTLEKTTRHHHDSKLQFRSRHHAQIASTRFEIAVSPQTSINHGFIMIQRCTFARDILANMA